MIVYHELASLQKDLGFSAKTLYGISNNIAKHYHTVLVPKKDGTKRKLSVPDVMLKRVQRAIADNILSQYPVSRYATAYKPGASVQKNAGKHVGKQKILKLDVKGFFDNILYSQVKDIVFYEKKFSEPIRILLSMLCYFNDSLPQGAPTSPAIANIIMYQFDQNVGSFCKQNNVTYTRYCDDMIFSGDFDERQIVSFVTSELKKLGLFLKDKKTAVIPNSKRQIVTGIVVNQKANVARQYKSKIRQEMFFIKKFGIDGHLQKTGINNRQKYLNSLKGRIAFVLQTLPGDKEFLKYKNYLANLK
ncbi:MAG: RNA-directed DNA polymerase [Clostridia bacterium]|nr:RNA-directed DNA polymerase [Clostridia bacterium]